MNFPLQPVDDPFGPNDPLRGPTRLALETLSSDPTPDVTTAVAAIWTRLGWAPPSGNRADTATAKSNEGTPVGTEVASLTRVGPTRLLLTDSHAEWEDMMKKWLPGLLTYSYLVEDATDEVVSDVIAFLKDRVHTLGGRRFSKVLPGWLGEYALAKGLGANYDPVRATLDATTSSNFAVVFVCSQASPDETDDQRHFRSAARDAALSDVQWGLEDLDGYDPGAGVPVDEAYRDFLGARVRKNREEVSAFAELA